jgi:hypothetical protein
MPEETSEEEEEEQEPPANQLDASKPDIEPLLPLLL